MAIRAALLNGNNLNRDSDFSKIVETLTEPGIIDGFEVSSSSVGVGKARVKCTRTGGEEIYVLVYNTSSKAISGNGDVYIKVNQSAIDNGELNNEDGTGIATIEVGTLPEVNALILATKSGSSITDKRYMIPDLDEINDLAERMTTAENRIDQIVEEGAARSLQETGIVGEKYTLSDKLFLQTAPTFANSTVGHNVGDVSANSEVHIQRIGSGTANNQIKIAVKKVGSPTTGLTIQVKAGTKVDVSDNEAYWYGSGSVIASGTIAYSSITTSFQEFTINLGSNFGGTKGQLLDVVIFQTGNIVNNTNYYQIGCDSTQISEAFRCIGVNGSTRTPSILVPYCSSTGFVDKNLCKAIDSILVGETSFSYSGSGNSSADVSAKNEEIFDIISSSSFSGKVVYNLTQNSGNYAELRIAWDDTMTGARPVDGTQAYAAIGGTGERIVYGNYNYNNKISWYRYQSSGGTSAGTFKAYAYIEAKGGSDIHGTPREVIAIGQQGQFDFLGDVGGELVVPINYPTGERIIFKEHLGGEEGDFTTNFTVPKDGFYYVRCVKDNDYTSNSYIRLPSGFEFVFRDCEMVYLYAGVNYLYHITGNRYQSTYGGCNFYVYN